VIPVMLMGRIVSKKKYEFYEYTVALLISFGMVCFFFGKENSRESNSVTTFSGILIMVGYMAFDSFTSIWQGELFKVSCAPESPLPVLYLPYWNRYIIRQK
jgi:adenosine 3'-phospho 5'-phosphosulfate transporter B2